MHLSSKVLTLWLVVAALVLLVTGAPQGNKKGNNRGKIRRHDEKIKGSYIVVYASNSEGAGAKANGKAYQGKNRTAAEQLNMVTITVDDESELDEILEDPDIIYIEEDGPVHAAVPCDTLTAESWGQDRVDQTNLPMNGVHKPDRTNNSVVEVMAYIVDTGIDENHPQFDQNRARMGPEFMSDTGPGDGNGHGTHCAGTIGSYHHGLNRDVKMMGVKVLNSGGSGTWSAVISGINFVATNHTDRGGYGVARSVLSMSLGGGYSSSVNQAVEDAVNAGVVVVVAAGNSNADAANYSPASAPNAITVGSTTSSDAKSSFSNYGSIVDIQAPGSSITSTWIGSSGRRRREAPSMDDTSVWDDSARYRRQAVNRPRRSSARAPGSCTRSRCQAPVSSTTSATTSTTTSTTTPTTTTQRPVPAFGALATISGTSMACPHVAGAVTLIMMNSPTWLSPLQIDQEIKRISAKNVVSGFNSATTADLVQVPHC